MKKLVTGLMLLSSLSAFAGLKDCQNLLGNYECAYENSNVRLVLAKGNSANALDVKIEGEGGKYIVDGKKRASKEDDSEYTALCTAGKKIEIRNVFRDQLQIVSLTATDEGILYSLEQSRGGLSLTCKRI